MIEIAGSELSDTRRERERLRMRELKRWREIHFAGLLADRFHDRRAIVTRIDAPETCGAIEHFVTVRRRVVHVLRAHDETRTFLERAVRSERNPERFEIVRRVLGIDVVGKGHGLAPWI